VYTHTHTHTHTHPHTHTHTHPHTSHTHTQLRPDVPFDLALLVKYFFRDAVPKEQALQVQLKASYSRSLRPHTLEA
jgi:ABC-type Zn2+ transport system substrate-binding protein/surface adhesin